MANQEKELLEKLEALDDLLTKQDRALKLANEIISMKNRLIELCEEETEFYKRLNKKARRALWIAFGWIVIRTTIDIIHLLA